MWATFWHHNACVAAPYRSIPHTSHIRCVTRPRRAKNANAYCCRCYHIRRTAHRHPLLPSSSLPTSPWFSLALCAVAALPRACLLPAALALLVDAPGLHTPAASSVRLHAARTLAARSPHGVVRRAALARDVRKGVAAGQANVEVRRMAHGAAAMATISIPHAANAPRGGGKH